MVKDKASSNRQPAPVAKSAQAPPQHRPVGAHGLDSGWDRKLAKGLAHPDFTLDLHGCTLDAAHGRLLHGLTQAKAMGARVVLLVAGRPRPADPADRTSRRGAIRSKVIDWLAASEHAAGFAAIRGAHPRHGGHGALYIVLKRKRL
jgi:DNA-nicking Smr family endonuclease